MVDRPLSNLLPSEHVFDIPPPKKPRTVKKCRFCRERKRPCSFSDGLPAEKCKLCQEKGLSCSEPQLASRSKKDYHSTQLAFDDGLSNVCYYLPAMSSDTADEFPATMNYCTSDSWSMSELSLGLSEKEPVLLLCLHTVLLIAIEELVSLATALIKPYRRDRNLESTVDAIPMLTSAVDNLKAVARAVNARMLEAGSGPHLVQAQNALTAHYFQFKHAWGHDEASTSTCKAAVTHFQQLGYANFAYVLQIGLVQQKTPMSVEEVEDMCSNRVLFSTAVEHYKGWGNVPLLSQFLACQLFTPRDLIHVPAIAASVLADGRPDFLGRSVFQILYDADIRPPRLLKHWNWSDNINRTILHQALQKCDISMIHFLWKVEADFGKCCLNGLSPLHVSACQGHLEAVELLFARTKWPLNVHDAALRTPFWYASRGSHLELMSLLASNPDVDIDSKDIHGLSPLSVAARDGHIKVIKHIMKLRSDKWELGVLGALMEHMHDHQPLQLASKNGHLNCVDLILTYRTWNAGGLEWERALNLAVQRGDAILRGKLLDLYRINAGVADLTQFSLPKSRKHCDISDVDLSQHVQGIHGTKPGVFPEHSQVHADKVSTFDKS